jgi:hypothetical protein
MSALKPGRYELRGGPGGQYALRHMDTLRRDSSGRRVYANATGHYTERWQLLASLRVRPGHAATFYGVIAASERVWTLV